MTMIQPPPTTNPRPASGHLPPGGSHLGAVRFSTAKLLVMLVLFLVSGPFSEQIKGGHLIEAVLLTFVLLTGLVAVSRQRSTLAIAVALVTPAVVCKWVNHYRPDLAPPQFFLVGGELCVVFIIANLMRFILRAPRVDSEVLCAGISTYLLLGLLWAFGYNLVGCLVPDCFAFSVPATASHTMKGFNSLYFSFITLTTVGYGDITPVSNVARMLAIMEAMTGTLFVGVLIARLVSLYSTAGPANAAAPAASESDLKPVV